MAKTKIESVEIESNVKKTLEELDLVLERSLEMIGGSLERHAKEYCPVDTGRLRNSITYDVNKNGKYVVVGTNVEYAPYVELGSSRRKVPKPYLRPAVERHLEEYKKIIQDMMSYM